MNKRLLMFLISMFVAAIVISGCGSDNNDENENNNDNDTNTEENENNNENNEENENNENNEDEEVSAIDEDKFGNENEDNDENEDEEDGAESSIAISDSAFSDLIEYMEDETEGTASILYETDETQEHEMEGVTTTLEGYTFMELNDFNENFSIPFDDQTDGGVVIAKYTVKNDTDDDVSYMPTLDLSYVGASKIFTNNTNVLPEDEQLGSILAPSNDYMIEAGEEVTGHITYSFGEDRLEELLDEGTADVEVPQPQTDKDDISSRLGEEGTFTFSLNAESADKASETESQDFYEDRVTFENMGDKEMIESEEDIGDSEELGDFTVTLEGYQFTDFEPNADEAPRFEGNENGLVLLTVKFNVDNDSDSEIGINSVTSKLTMNDGSQYTLNEGMLLAYKNDDTIESGDDGEILQVYALDKEQYDKIWKDKSFEVEIGPMKDADAKDISKGKKATFELK